MRQHLFMSPGMFGFGRLGSYNYFAHLERELVARFASAGHELIPHVIDELPTASIRRRAVRLAELVAQSSANDPIHLLGHSTGGLDARLVASPTSTIVSPWLPRLRSITMMNTPHFGTPLASFFATSNGQHVLKALSALTVAGLTLGAQPLAAASVVLGVVRASDQALPFKLTLLDRSIGSVVGLVDDATCPEVKTFLGAIEDDQGSMLQLSPESMDLVVAGFADRPGVTYQSTISMARTPTPRKWLQQLRHPWRAISLSLFYALHRLTARLDERYPCAAMRARAPFAGDATEAMLARAFGGAVGLDENDGIVPLRSQLWSNVVWAGYGDHLDVLGHYEEPEPAEGTPPELRHRDWLNSGSGFTAREQAALVDAIANGMITSSDNRPGPNS